MIRLIKNRIRDPKDNDPLFKKTCPHCGAIFEYNYSDTECYGTLDFDSEIRCPDCHKVSSHHFWYKAREKR